MKSHSSGFTLLEFMLTIAILAIVVSMGVPNFRDFVRSSRMAAAANDIITDFNLARSEAVKRHVPVTLCKSDDGETCAGAADPFNQWIVFVDDADAAQVSGDDGNGVVDDDELVLRRRGPQPESITVLTNANAVSLSYLPNGFPNVDLGGRVTQFLLCDDRGNIVATGGDSAARFVNIEATGRPTVIRNIATITAQALDCPS